MSCACGTSYIVRSGDTLFLIAERQLGNGNRWQEITKPNCTPFSEDEARKLQIGDEVCLPNGSTQPPESDSFANIVSPQTYAAMFPNRNSLYSYDNLVKATQKYPNFCNQGSTTQRKLEAAAFLANIAHETSGLKYIEELRCINGGCENEYCDSGNTTYPCVSGRSYHGRGPIQLSWNYNYGAAGRALGLDLLANPDLVKTDGAIAFSTALWFWMTPQSPKPSCHEVMSGAWTPSSDDASKGRTPGFGMTINIINGGLECGIPTDARVESRVNSYRQFCEMLGVNTDEQVYCDRMRPYV
jgi:basic endochitinase B